MNYPNTSQLRGWLRGYPALAAMESFELSDEEFAKHLAEVRSRPESERRDAAAFRCMPWDSFKEKKAEAATPEAVMIQQDQIVRNHAVMLVEQKAAAKMHSDALGVIRAEVIDRSEKLDVSLRVLSKTAEAQSGALLGVKVSVGHVADQVEKAESQLRDTITRSSQSNANECLAVRVDARTNTEKIVGILANQESVDKIHINYVNESLAEIGEVLQTLRADCQSISDGLVAIIEEQRTMAARKPMFSKWLAISFAVLVLVLLGADIAFGQNTNPAIVVATCGTVPSNYPATGQRAPTTVDTTGKGCSDASGGGGSSVTIVGISAGILPITTAGQTLNFAVTIQGTPSGLAVNTSSNAPYTVQYPNTGISFMSTGGSALFTPDVTTFGAGRVSATFDRGAGAIAMNYKWEAQFQAASGATAGLPVRVYIYSSQYSTSARDYGASDAFIVSESQFNNFRLLGSVYASNPVANVGPFFASGEVYIAGEFISVGFWNASGQTLAGTVANRVTLTPIGALSRSSP